MTCFKILSWHKKSDGTICSNMSHKITIISFYILRIFMTVFTISEYFIGHTLLQAVSYILKRRGNSWEEGARLPGEVRQRSGMSGMILSELSEGDNGLSDLYPHFHPIAFIIIIQCFDPNKFRCKMFAWKQKRQNCWRKLNWNWRFLSQEIFSCLSEVKYKYWKHTCRSQSLCRWCVVELTDQW